MLTTLDDQSGALPATTPCILLRHARHPDHAADPALAAIGRHQRAQQPRRIQPIGLGAARPPVDENAGGIEYPVIDAAGAQQPMKPKSVIPRLVAGQNPDRPAEPGLRLRLFAREQRQ